MGDYALPSFDEYLGQMESYLEHSREDISRRITEAREEASDFQQHRQVFEEVCGLYSDAVASNSQTIALQEGMLEDDPEGQEKLEEFKRRSESEYLGATYASIIDFYNWALSQSPALENPRLSVGVELGFRLAGLTFDREKNAKVMSGIKERLLKRGLKELSEPEFVYHPELGEEHFAIVISGKRVFLGEIPSHKLLVSAPEKESLEGLSAYLPFALYGRYGVWIDPPREEKALERGARVIRPETVIFYRLEQQLLRHASLFS